MIEAYDESMFPDSVTVYDHGAQGDSHGGPSLGPPASPGLTLAAYVEPADQMGRQEANRTPEGEKRWGVFTASDPGVMVDWLVVWRGRKLRCVGKASDQSSGAGVLWRTECVEVS